MKKKLLISVMLCGALFLAACGKKNETETTAQPVPTSAVETGAADTAAQSTAEAESLEPSSEEIAQNSIYAIVHELEGTKLTVETEDGKAMTFDIAKAETNPAYPLMAGDEVEIAFLGSEPIDGMAVSSVLMSTPFEMTSEDYNEDGSLWGTIVAADEKTITVTEDDGGRAEAEGETAAAANYVFSIAPYAQIVTAGGLQPGAGVYISYTGELDKPLAYRICTEDMQEEPQSDVYAMSGTVEKVEQGVLYLTVADGSSFCFSADDAVLANAVPGEQVEVVYSGSIRQRVILADEIVKK